MALVTGLSDRERKEQLASALRERALREDRAYLQGSFIEFFRAAWPALDASVYTHGWHLEAIAEHLEAVARGQIRKLLINVPPRHSKTLLTSVAWPAWLWAQDYDPDFPLMGPQAKVLCLSYSDQLVLDNAVAARRLIESDWYQERWGSRVRVSPDQAAKNRFDLTAGGTRISASFGGTVTGRGGDIRIIDDPIKAEEGNSETVRNKVISLYDGTLKSRITDPRHCAEVVIMQRVHDGDLSGHVLANDPDFVHLRLPAEYDSSDHCVTSIGWEDPREEDGDLLWPERFGPKELAPYKRNPYEWSGQWQQRPVTRGGNIFKEEWWQRYEVPVNMAYDFTPLHIIASLDTAFKEKQENDYSALTVWVAYDDHRTNRRRLMLVAAWKKRLPLHGVHVPRRPEETVTREEASMAAEGSKAARMAIARKDELYYRRAMPKWGLIEWVAHTCTQRKVKQLVVEDSARGHDVNNEIRRLYGARTWGVIMVPARGDKVARAHSVVDLFTDDMIYAPGQTLCLAHDLPDCNRCYQDGAPTMWRWRDWAYAVIKDMMDFPKGTHDDLVDSCLSGDIGIVTGRGVVPISDVKIGDIVMTHKGRWRSVKATGHRLSDHYYRLKAKGLEEIRITGEHPALAMTVAASFSEPPYKRSYGVEWKTVASLKTRPFKVHMRDGKPVRYAMRVKHDALVLPRGTRDTRGEPQTAVDLLQYWPTAVGDENFVYIRRECTHRLPDETMMAIAATQAAGRTLTAVAQDFGVSIPTVAKAYAGGHQPRFDKTIRYIPLDEEAGWAFGLFAAEGCINRKAMLWACDLNALNRVNAWVERTFGRQGTIRRGLGCYRLQLFALGAMPLFATLGHGAPNKIVPTWVFDAPDEFVRGFVAGFSHGDGYQPTNYPHRTHLTSTSKSLLWGIRLLLARLGIPAFTGTTKLAGTREVFGNQSQCLNAYRLDYSTAPSGSAVVDNAYIGTHIERAERIEEPLEVFNLSVEEDESYVTVGGTVHNCVHALRYLRDNTGWAIRREERQLDEETAARARPAKPGVAAGYFS